MQYEFAAYVLYVSVRPSVRFWYSIRTAYRIVIVFSPYGNPTILVLSASNTFTKYVRAIFITFSDPKFNNTIPVFSGIYSDSPGFYATPPNMYAAKRIVGGGAKQDVIDKRLL